ncbi:hypothetical protein ACSVDE_17015 [Pseudalkalibacillus sp. Hm43]|uniref:hypothetical protein n=1 Tax=Pseudalkalibacillus sp. Hm43 TaxID=3450742 RepID=UPI003F44152C
MSLGSRREQVRAVIDRAVESAMDSIEQGSDVAAGSASEEDITAAVSIGIGPDAEARASAEIGRQEMRPEYALNVRTLTAAPRA